MLNSLVIPPCCSWCNPDVSCPLIFLLELPLPRSVHTNASVSLVAFTQGSVGEAKRQGQRCRRHCHPLQYLLRSENNFPKAFLWPRHQESLFFSLLTCPELSASVLAPLPLHAQPQMPLLATLQSYFIFRGMPSFLPLFTANVKTLEQKPHQPLLLD